MSRLIILDRDGVINQDSWNYIRSVDDLIMLPGSAEAIGRLTAAGYQIAIATNQSGIARGYYSDDDLNAIHAKIIACAEAAGGRIETVVYCPHFPDAGCNCRKPKPGLLYEIARRLDCSLQNVPFIGDRITDFQAAEAVGAIPYAILSTMTDPKELAAYPHVPVFESLSAFTDHYLNESPSKNPPFSRLREKGRG